MDQGSYVKANDYNFLNEGNDYIGNSNRGSEGSKAKQQQQQQNTHMKELFKTIPL